MVIMFDVSSFSWACTLIQAMIHVLCLFGIPHSPVIILINLLLVITADRKRAEGEAESKYYLGLGIARQYQAILDGLRDSVRAFSENVPGTSAKDIMDMALVLSTSTPHGPGAVRDVAVQMREVLSQGASVKHEN